MGIKGTGAINKVGELLQRSLLCLATFDGQIKGNSSLQEGDGVLLQDCGIVFITRGIIVVRWSGCC